MEAAVNLYAGPSDPPRRPAPARHRRTQHPVTLRYDHGGLMIMTEGRALDRAAEGESLRVLNLASRNTITAVAAAPGLVTVGPDP
jgi:flagellar basal body P-ring formation protein FlgA